MYQLFDGRAPRRSVFLSRFKGNPFKSGPGLPRSSLVHGGGRHVPNSMYQRYMHVPYQHPWQESHWYEEVAEKLVAQQRDFHTALEAAAISDPVSLSLEAWLFGSCIM